MRLTTRLLLGLVLGVSLLLAAVIAVLDRRLYARIGEEQVAQLQSEARLLAAQWTDPTEADAVADAAGTATGHRVTLIDATGVVLGDSEFDRAKAWHTRESSFAARSPRGAERRHRAGPANIRVGGRRGALCRGAHTSRDITRFCAHPRGG